MRRSWMVRQRGAMTARSLRRRGARSGPLVVPLAVLLVLGAGGTATAYMAASAGGAGSAEAGPGQVTISPTPTTTYIRDVNVVAVTRSATVSGGSGSMRTIGVDEEFVVELDSPFDLQRLCSAWPAFAPETSAGDGVRRTTASYSQHQVVLALGGPAANTSTAPNAPTADPVETGTATATPPDVSVQPAEGACPTGAPATAFLGNIAAGTWPLPPGSVGYLATMTLSADGLTLTFVVSGGLVTTQADPTVPTGTSSSPPSTTTSFPPPTTTTTGGETPSGDAGSGGASDPSS